jgi:phenylacetate-CoA ligase
MDHETIKTAMLHQYYRWRRWVPGQLLYHRDYFLVEKLLCSAPEQRARAQDMRLRHILSTALAHVPFYRRRVRLDADTIGRAPLNELIAQFPYIEKAEVMAHQRDFLDERVDPRFLRYAASNGSSGTGIGVWRSKREGDIEKAFYAHAWGSFGFRFDRSRYLRIGCDAVRPLAAPPTWRLGNRLMLSPDHLRPAQRAAIVAALQRFRPQFIHAYPSSALALAELLAPGELAFPVRAVLLASEPASPAQLALIGRVFDAPVSISYGLTERTNLAFATCAGAAREPYRFEPLYGRTETRPRHGRKEIVGTSLWNETMPLIRYCTGDFAAIDEHGRCDAIQGRLQEFVVDRHGNRLPGLTIALDASSWDFVRACQLYQREPGKVTLRVVPRQQGLSPDQVHALLAAPVRHWGPGIEFDCVEVAEIADSPGGKRRFVVNECLRPELGAARTGP